MISFNFSFVKALVKREDWKSIYIFCIYIYIYVGIIYVWDYYCIILGCIKREGQIKSCNWFLNLSNKSRLRVSFINSCPNDMI